MFKVIEAPDQLRALGEAGLLWYYATSLKKWWPSTNPPDTWKQLANRQLSAMVRRKEYAILIEDD